MDSNIEISIYVHCQVLTCFAFENCENNKMKFSEYHFRYVFPYGLFKYSATSFLNVGKHINLKCTDQVLFQSHHQITLN